MPHKTFARRLLSAFAGTAPAFTREPRPVPRSTRRRLLSAFTGSTPAFTPGTGADQHTSITPVGLSTLMGEPPVPPRPTPIPADTVVDMLHSAIAGEARVADKRHGRRLADDFAARSAHDRLTARVWLEGAEMRLTYQLLEAVDNIGALREQLDRDRIVDLAIPLNRARTIARDHASTQQLASDLDVVHRRVRDLADAYDLALNLASTRHLALARALARDLTRDLAPDLARVLRSVFVRSPDHELPQDISRLFQQDSEAPKGAIEVRLRAFSQTVTGLRSAARNMVDADLRDIDLHDFGLRERLLNGVHWSAGTQWPVELRAWIADHSDSIGLDLYKIHTRDDSTDRTTSTA